MSIATLKAESKKIVRNPIAKVVVTWTDPLIDLSISPITSENNRVSFPQQTADLVTDVPRKWAHTNDTDVTLDGTWYPMSSTLLKARGNEVGWWGTQNADAQGDFATSPSLILDFAVRPIEGFTVAGDNALNEFPVDFTVTLYYYTGSVYVPTEILNVTGNSLLVYNGVFNNPHYNTSRMVLDVHKWNIPGKIVKIVEFYSSIVEVFENDQLLYLTILEEFESSAGTLPVGNISCNELDLKIQNLDDRFFVGNTDSTIRRLIKRNRKIEPFIGFEYENGTKEYIPKGLYWSQDWAVADLDTGAQTTARDRMELFRKEEFPASTIFPTAIFNKSTKEIITIVLDSLTPYMYDLFYDISDLDDNYIIPVVLPEFFNKKTYFDVIKDLSAASLAYSYMDIPTDAETSANGPLCKDMLRIKRVTTVFPDVDVETGAEEILKSDFIEKNQPAKSEEIANIINVVYKTFTRPDPSGDPDKWESEDFTYTAQDEQSKSEYGRLVYEFSDLNFIQTVGHAQDIADQLLGSFKIGRKDIELQAFGDITLKLSDKLIVPEYQKGDINTRGTFAIRRLSTNYDGSLRMQIDGRKIVDDSPIIDYIVMQDTDGAPTELQDTDGATTLYQDAGT